MDFNDDYTRCVLLVSLSYIQGHRFQILFETLDTLMLILIVKSSGMLRFVNWSKATDVSNIVIPSSSGSSSVIFIGTLVTKLPKFRNVIVSSYSRSGSARVVTEKEVSKIRFTFFFSVKQHNIYRNT